MEAAESTFLKMAEVDPDEVGPKMTLSAFYASQRDFNKALNWTLQALEIQPENATIQSALASIFPRRT
jgi:Flp pilus assembly protein TadD